MTSTTLLGDAIGSGITIVAALVLFYLTGKFSRWENRKRNKLIIKINIMHYNDILQYQLNKLRFSIVECDDALLKGPELEFAKKKLSIVLMNDFPKCMENLLDLFNRIEEKIYMLDNLRYLKDFLELKTVAYTFVQSDISNVSGIRIWDDSLEEVLNLGEMYLSAVERVDVHYKKLIDNHIS